MSLCLAVDTVTAVGSVALARGDELIAEQTFGDRQHASQLLPSIMACLETAGARPGHLREVLIADGPGSFTGIRIGFATVAGFVTELSPRLRVASSMLASAVSRAHDDGGAVIAMYDALRGDVYAGCYRVRESVIHTVFPPRITTVAALREEVTDVPVAAVGDGSLSYASEVAAWIGTAPSKAPTHARTLLGLRRLTGGLRDIHDLSSFEPDYGRKAEAQVRWERQHGRRLSDSIGSH